jgi:hypothetical protein
MESSLQSWVQQSALRVTLSGGVPPIIQRSLSFPNSPLPRAPNPSTSEYELLILQRLEREEKQREDTKRAAEAAFTANQNKQRDVAGPSTTLTEIPPQQEQRGGNRRSSLFSGTDDNARTTHPAIHEDPKPPSSSVTAALEKASLSSPSTEMGRQPACLFTSACTFTATDRHWHCHACTYANKHDTISCEICNYLKKPEEESSERGIGDVWTGSTVTQNLSNSINQIQLNSTKKGSSGGNPIINKSGNGSGSSILVVNPNSSTTSSVSSSSKKWICTTCTLENASQSQVCEACGTAQHNHTLV